MGAKGMRRLALIGGVVAAVGCGVAATAMAASDVVVAWKRQLGTAGEDWALGVATDAAGNVYLTGLTEGSLGGPFKGGYYDAWVAKYAADGRRLWKRQLGTASSEYANGVVTDAAGNVYLTGLTTGSLGGANQGDADAWVAKYAADGRRLWTRQLGTADFDGANDVATDAAGNVYLTGWTDGSLGGAIKGYSRDAWVAKYAADGHFLWTRQLGTTGYDWANGLATDAAGNVYLTGWTTGSLGGPFKGGHYDAWVAKYAADGRRLWTRQLGSAEEDEATSVATDAAGNVYLTGRTQGWLGGANQGSWDAWVAKYAADGRRLWKRQLGSADDDRAYGVATDAADNVYLTGFTFGSLGGANQGGADAWMAKYAADGLRLWTRQLGTASYEYAYGVATDAAGNVYLTGYTYGSFGGANQGQLDAWVVKLSPTTESADGTGGEPVDEPLDGPTD